MTENNLVSEALIARMKAEIDQRKMTLRGPGGRTIYLGLSILIPDWAERQGIELTPEQVDYAKAQLAGRGKQKPA